MTSDRRSIAEAAAEAVAGKSEAELRAVSAVVGFDGFVDSIIKVVDQRHSMAPEDFRPVSTITGFADRCAAAAGLSTCSRACKPRKLDTRVRLFWTR